MLTTLLLDNESQKPLSNLVTFGAKIIEDTIYFTDQNQYIYNVPLSGGKATLLVGEAVGSYNILEDLSNIFSPPI